MELYTGCFEINNGRINGTNKKKKRIKYRQLEFILNKYFIRDKKMYR